MKIVITGTRGIPNRYGGFEAFAEEVSRRWAEKGHQVMVYNPSNHPYRKDHLEKVVLICKPLPQKIFGRFAILIYDFLCLRDAYRRRPDVILNCGYSNALFTRRKKPVPVITLTDGLEWKRKQWNGLVRFFLRFTEKHAVRKSNKLVVDHPEIATYFQMKYGVSPALISYGASIPKETRIPEGTSLNCLLADYITRSGQGKKHHFSPDLYKTPVLPGRYYLVISRTVPENNLRMILEGYLHSGTTYSLLLIGDSWTPYGKKLIRDFAGKPGILFAGSIYDRRLLHLLSHHSRGYFHGHSVGGTNPSLLEAMAAGCLIAAHDNPFNRYVLGEEALYFSTADKVTSILKNWDIYLGKKETFVKNNQEKIRREYSWEKVAEQYLKLFETLIVD